jgi:ribosomal protein S18 acetylase RimI-like enzyme
MNPAIRPAREADRPEIASILERVGIFTPDQISAALDLVAQAFANPERGEFLPFVAELDGKIAGYVLYGPTPLADRVFDLYWIAVLPEYQARGIGKLLLQFVERAVAERHGRMLLIETSSKESYGRTRQFYEHAGYREISRIKDFYRKEHDKIVYSRDFR